MVGRAETKVNAATFRRTGFPAETEADEECGLCGWAEHLAMTAFHRCSDKHCRLAKPCEFRSFAHPQYLCSVGCRRTALHRVQARICARQNQRTAVRVSEIQRPQT